MAELDTSGGGKKGHKKGGQKKKNVRVDLTAMVDLAFLLITFFILTTTLARPKSQELIMPDKDQKNQQQLAVAETRTMTLLLGDNNKLEWFVGIPGKTAPKVIGYGKNDLRKTLIDEDAAIKATHGANNGMIVIVKPSDKSNYKNVVTVMDELNIANIQQRAIVDITPVELALLKRDGLY
jgi:biopolymer transport protein ExbD